MSRAVFLDRDGTLNVERYYLRDPEALEIFPGTGLALKRLMDAGYVLFIVTNQSGIGRGYYLEKDMHAVNDRLTEVLAADGGLVLIQPHPQREEVRNVENKSLGKMITKLLIRNITPIL